MKKLMGVLSALVLWAGSASAETIHFAFDGNDAANAQVNFNRDDGSFYFSPQNAANFHISGVQAGSAATMAGLLSLNGTIGGTFVVDRDNIHTSTDSYTGDVTQSAAVTSQSAYFNIDDGLGHTFTSTLNFNSISVTNTSDGFSDEGKIVTRGQVTLSNFVYDGSNAGLLSLAENNRGNAIVSFTFGHTGESDILPSVVTLSYLTHFDSDHPDDPHQVQTSFSGSVASAAPVPGSWLMLATGTMLIGGVGAIRRRRLLMLA